MARRKTTAPPTPAAPEAPAGTPTVPAQTSKPRATRARAASTASAGTRRRTVAAAPAPDAPDPLGAALTRLEGVAARFEAGCDSLLRALDELPRPADFQPLADHLYEFARTAPPLVESLQDVPRAADAIQQSVRALEQLAETLHFAHESFSESLLRLPRAEDYEPLAAPLREFARVSPALRESLADVLRVARPLGAAVHEMEGVAHELRATGQRLGDALTRAAAVDTAPPVTPTRGDGAFAAARAAAACMQLARQTIVDALATLPREPAYADLARQLRELATVSPSLMDWLRQTPTLVAPLSASVEALRAAAEQLDSARATLVETLDEGA